MDNLITLSDSAYQKLVKDVASIIAQGEQRAKDAAAVELVKTYWLVGKRIVDASLPEKAGYQAVVLRELAKDLKIDLRTLQRSLVFFNAYEEPPQVKGLQWGHYRELIKLRDPHERQWYQKLAAESHLTARQLAQSIQGDRYEKDASKKASGAKRPKLKRPTDPMYVYQAQIEHVADADTIVLNIDLGFEVHKSQRLRLALIDAQKRTDDSGKQARGFVLRELTHAAALVVKTDKIDIYGRYVGHLFYSPQPLDPKDVFFKGHYLNQRLIDQGLADVL